VGRNKQKLRTVRKNYTSSAPFRQGGGNHEGKACGLKILKPTVGEGKGRRGREIPDICAKKKKKERGEYGWTTHARLDRNGKKWFVRRWGILMLVGKRKQGDKIAPIKAPNTERQTKKSGTWAYSEDNEKQIC